MSGAFLRQEPWRGYISRLLHKVRQWPDGLALCFAPKAEVAKCYAPLFQPHKGYLGGAPVVAPNGDSVTAKVDFTSGATYDPANWNPAPAIVAINQRATGLSIVLGGI